MKNIGMLLFLSFIFLSSTCKNDPKSGSHPVGQDHPHPLVDYHCYKYYKMKFTDIQRPPNSLTGRLKSEGVKYAFIIGSDLDRQIIANQNNPNFEYSVYKFERGNVKFQNCRALFSDNLPILISINNSLSNNTMNDDCNRFVRPELRGQYGCNPGLIYNDKGILTLTGSGDNAHKYLPLATAFHNSLGGRKVATILECYCFKISNLNLVKLNNTVQNSGHRNHEMGLDQEGSLAKLLLFEPDKPDTLEIIDESY
jgi:hypothetical protein